MWRLLYLLQLAAGEDSVLPRLVPPVCGAAQDGEILVCKRRDESPRYGPAQPRSEEMLLPKAEFRLLGKARATLGGAQRSVGGFSAPAAAVTVRIPL